MDVVPAIQAFLPTQDWNGRQVALFCTMGGMGDRKELRTMRELIPGAHVAGELWLDAATFKDQATLDARVRTWVEQICGRVPTTDG